MLKRLTLLLPLMLGCASASAEEVPTLGILYHSTEASSMTFNCQLSSGGLLNCEFNQTSVRRKLPLGDAAKEREMQRQQYLSNRSEYEKDCGDGLNVQQMLDVIEGRTKPPPDYDPGATKAIESMPVEQRADMVASLRLMQKYCTSKSEASWMNVVDHDISIRTRTCYVSSNPFKQSFRRVSDPASKASSWVVQGDPEGPCGLVQLSRFEQDKGHDGFWVYYARKAITNPRATVFPGLQCGQLDQTEYFYDWKSRELRMGCDYVEFSPL